MNDSKDSRGSGSSGSGGGIIAGALIILAISALTSSGKKKPPAKNSVSDDVLKPATTGGLPEEEKTEACKICGGEVVFHCHRCGAPICRRDSNQCDYCGRRFCTNYSYYGVCLDDVSCEE